MSPELEDYIEEHISPEPEVLKKIDRKTNLYRLNGRMCSGHIQGRLLKMLTSMIRPQKVLELGTFTGYSALCVAEALENGAEVHTVEIDDELEEDIIEHLKESEHGDKVKLYIGDALEIMDKWEPSTFDMGIIDADKRQYSAYFDRMLPLIKPGGYILVDNTLWDGHVVEKGKHSSQTQGILDFNERLTQYPGLEVAMIPIRDGITLVRKLPV